MSSNAAAVSGSTASSICTATAFCRDELQLQQVLQVSARRMLA